jgi:hypothetical protein
VPQLVQALCYKPEVAGSIPDEFTEIFNLPNPSSLTIALGATQPPIEMCAINLTEGKERPERKTDKFPALCQPILKKMWDPRRLRT